MKSYSLAIYQFAILVEYYHLYCELMGFLMMGFLTNSTGSLTACHGSHGASK
jgi:hypothetical protein